jgi:HSP20 family molecular chaperone IbpA
MTSGPDRRDDFQRALDGLVDDAFMLLEGRTVHAVNDQSTGVPTPNSELIESSDHFTLIVHAPGYRNGELKASLVEDDLVVSAPDFGVHSTLHAPVESQSLVSTYVNGVLSVRLRKSP